MDETTRSSSFGRWRAAAFAALAAVVLGVASGSTARQPAVPAPEAVELYVSDGDYADVEEQWLVPLDPATLIHLEGRDGIAFGTPDWDSALSADGSTMVSLATVAEHDPQSAPAASDDPHEAPTLSADDALIIVRDGRTGEERTRFQPPAPVLFPRLSQDGSRLVVMVHPDYERFATDPPGPPAPARWYVFDTRDGRRLATAQGDGPVDSQQFWIDPAARRLYHAPDVGAADDRAPRQLRLVAHDLSTGAEVGRLELSDVPAGTWTTDRTAGGEPVRATLTPGVALSPDGRQLAVVHADADAVTLIDAERLAVERAVALTRPTSLLDRLLGMVPLVPRGAAAKASEATTLRAVFAPDGRRLYVFGVIGTISNAGTATVRGAGLRLVDLTDGEIVAEALPDARIDHVVLTPDGRGVYVAGPRGNFSSSWILRRLDAGTLSTLAEREFVGYRWFLLRSVTPGAP